MSKTRCARVYRLLADPESGRLAIIPSNDLRPFRRWCESTGRTFGFELVVSLADSEARSLINALERGLKAEPEEAAR